jgi:hypothetical protein
MKAILPQKDALTPGGTALFSDVTVQNVPLGSIKTEIGIEEANIDLKIRKWWIPDFNLAVFPVI